MKLFHFNLGNSDSGPIGYCATIQEENEESALARLKELLPEAWDTDDMYDITPEGMDRKDEYIAVYFNPDGVTVNDIDEVDEVEGRRL